MDVFAAVNTPHHLPRAFLDKPVDLNIVRELIVRAQRAASGGNLQSWNVYALANKPLADFKRIVAERIARDDPRHAKSEYPIYPRGDVRALQGAARGARLGALRLARHRADRRSRKAPAIQEELRVLQRAGCAVHYH